MYSPLKQLLLRWVWHPGHTRIRVLKEELTWTKDKWLQVISNIMLFKIIISMLPYQLISSPKYK